MVARGDLGVEIATEEVPLAQKRIIALCNRVGKPVITATQMLDSMQRNPRPTRAEASDVANAILDGTDAIMFSGETAAGRYPLESVETMARIAERAEQALISHEVTNRHTHNRATTITDVMGHAVQTMASELGAQAIVTATTSGHSARMIAKHRPMTRIVAATPKPEVARRLTVSWGVYPVIVPETWTTDEVLETAVEGALDAGHVKHGDLVIITAGVPVGQQGTTNLLKIHTIGEVLARGVGIGQRAVSGRAVASRKAADIRAAGGGRGRPRDHRRRPRSGAGHAAGVRHHRRRRRSRPRAHGRGRIVARQSRSIVGVAGATEQIADGGRRPSRSTRSAGLGLL